MSGYLIFQNYFNKNESQMKEIYSKLSAPDETGYRILFGSGFYDFDPNILISN